MVLRRTLNILTLELDAVSKEPSLTFGLPDLHYTVQVTVAGRQQTVGLVAQYSPEDQIPGQRVQETSCSSG